MELYWGDLTSHDLAVLSISMSGAALFTSLLCCIITLLICCYARRTDQEEENLQGGAANTTKLGAWMFHNHPKDQISIIENSHVHEETIDPFHHPPHSPLASPLVRPTVVPDNHRQPPPVPRGRHTPPHSPLASRPSTPGLSIPSTTVISLQEDDTDEDKKRVYDPMYDNNWFCNTSNKNEPITNRHVTQQPIRDRHITPTTASNRYGSSFPDASDDIMMSQSEMSAVSRLPLAVRQSMYATSIS